MIRLWQCVEVIYEAAYTREQAIELLEKLGNQRDSLEAMTDAALADALAATANQEDGGNGLYERLADDAGDWTDTADVGEWFGRVDKY